jgi:hypothetical protein
MSNESTQPRPGAVVLDYSRGALLKRGPSWWMRALWSHQARIDLAQRISFVQALAILAAISLAAGFLCITHSCVHPLVNHGFNPQRSLAALKAELSAETLACAWNALRFVPLCFCALVAALVLLSNLWVFLGRRVSHWARVFPVLSVGSVPILWFFVLFQLDGLAPFIARPDMWHELYNPVTNIARFAVLMGGIILLVLWIIDAGKLYQSLRNWRPARS